MSKIPSVKYRMLGDTIKVMFSSKSFTYKRGDKRFDKVVEAIRSGNEEIVPKICDFELIFKDSGLKFDRDTRQCLIDEEKLPVALNQKIFEFIEEEEDFRFLVNFWRKLAKNPSFHSREMLFRFLESGHFPLSPEGDFYAYKGVNKDFTDCHTGTFSNSVGTTNKMERRNVDDDPRNDCSNGFHVGTYGYASGFGKELMLVKVNPEKAVAVPSYDAQKLRVCEYEVIKHLANGEELPRDLVAREV